MRFLLDTNVLSEPMNKKPNQSLIHTLELHQHEIATASLVIYEMWFGCYRLPISRRRKEYQFYLETLAISPLPILPYGTKAALWNSYERARLISQGKTPALIDSQIAAVAATNDLILVTRNVKDFQYFEGLRIENWFDN
jgi:tRNA(fMet)-specific endonuclease VapC